MEYDLSLFGLKDTQPRRLVLKALRTMRKPGSPYDIQRRIEGRGGRVNAVTVYRILSAFEAHGLVHRHPCDGRFFLCAMPQRKGHHGFLHCTSCGKLTEFVNAALCKAEEHIARASRFRPHAHVSELVGICDGCAR